MMVLEFTDLRLKQFLPLLRMIFSHEPRQIYIKHIQSSNQFFKHRFHQTNIKPVSSLGLKMGNIGKWSYPFKQLRRVEALKVGSEDLYLTTFVFAGGYRAPPRGTYCKEPKDGITVPSHLCKIDLYMHYEQKLRYFNLSGIKLTDRDYKSVEIGTRTKKSWSLLIMPHEVIVSARVHCDKKSLTNV